MEKKVTTKTESKTVETRTKSKTVETITASKAVAPKKKTDFEDALLELWYSGKTDKLISRGSSK